MECLQRVGVGVVTIKERTFFLLVAAPMTDSGKMENDTVWGWSPEAGGCTGVNGRKDSRADTECANLQLLLPNMKVLGPTDCKMATGPKHTLIQVRLCNPSSFNL